MGKKRHTEHEHENEERWLLSYADMITLLMAFFVVLYAMSNVDSKKYAQLAASLSASLGPRQETPVRLDLYPPVRRGGDRARRQQDVNTPKPLPETPDPTKKEGGGPEKDLVRREKAERIQSELVKRLLQENDRADIVVTVSPDYRNVTIRLAASLLFQPGSAEMESSAVPMLRDMAEILVPLQLPVTIEGHTDNIPINTPQYQSNWQLSAARAANVLLYMQNQFGLSPALLSASGYGEFRPIAGNGTPEDRARNRRVEFVVAVPDEVEPSFVGQEAASPAPEGNVERETALEAIEAPAAVGTAQIIPR